jgi:hypothetical protein
VGSPLGGHRTPRVHSGTARAARQRHYGGEVGGEASPRWGLCTEQVHGGEGSPKHWVNVEAGRSGGTTGFRGGDGSPTNGVGFPMVL